MKSFSLFFCLFLVQFTNAQNNLNLNKLSRHDWSSIMRGNQPLQTKKSDNIELRGTPFVFDAYQNGIILVSDTLYAENGINFKLNAEDNEIWMQKDGKEELVLTESRITGLDLFVGSDTHRFRKLRLPDVKKNPLRFVEVLYRGTNCLLLKNTEKVFEAADYVDKGLAVMGRNYDNYATSVSYYVVNEKKIFRKISLKKNDIYKANLPLVEKNRDAINAFCKEQKISNPLEEEDAIDLLEFIDKLK
jgi:hypothetical protein